MQKLFIFIQNEQFPKGQMLGMSNLTWYIHLADEIQLEYVTSIRKNMTFQRC